MDLELADRVAVVTGASRGLGRAIAEALVAEGARVLAVARTAQSLEDLREHGRGAIEVAACDMRQAGAVARLPDAAIAAFGRIDAVFNNAGIAPAGRFVEHDHELWEDVFATNVLGPVALARSAGTHFLEQRSGKVVNIASTAGLKGKPGLVAYSASKGALLQFTKALAAEWAPHGVQVNAIAPGAFKTEAQQAVLDDEALLKRRLRKIPAGRMADPREIGSLACLLASPLSDYITGSVVAMDGGEVAKL